MDKCLVRDEKGLSGELFKPLGYQLATQAVLAGSAVGTTWFDGLGEPRLALMKVGHRLYLAGSSQQSDSGYQQLQCTLFDELLIEARARGDDGFLLYYADPEWEEVLSARIFGDWKVYPGRRNYFELALPNSTWPPHTPVMPEGIQLVKVDGALLAQTGLKHYEDLIEEMHSERESVEDFLSHSFGTVMVGDGSVLGWCLSEYNLNDRCEIGIGTNEAYQRKGLATLAGIHMINQALEKGIRRVGWHCWLRNEGSNATARKLGFKHINEHGAYYLPVNKQE